MANVAVPRQFEVGFVGLDDSGRKLACCVAGHGIGVVACDCNPQQVKALQNESPASAIHISATVKELTDLIHPFRTVVLCGSDPSGDSLRELLGQLDALDLVIDAGHCYFKDCERRARLLAERNIRHLALSVIDGEQAVDGSLLLVGGRPENYLSVRALLEAMAEETGAPPRLRQLDAAAAGHFVKMIYDGIQYALTRLALETFNLLKRELDLDEVTLRETVRAWPVSLRTSALDSDAARWTSQAARELGCPAPTIDAAVGMRVFSEVEKRNEFATTPFRQPVGHFGNDAPSVLEELRGALNAAVLITYAEGLALLLTGSQRYGFDLEVADVLRLWRGCCGKRAALLDEIAFAFESTPHLPNLLHDDDLSEKVMELQERLRHAVWRAGPLDAPVPVLTATLDYLDSFRGAWLPVNLIQVPPAPHRTRGSLVPAEELDEDWTRG